jgi:tetraacyldisaccharide 4'-kinase
VARARERGAGAGPSAGEGTLLQNEHAALLPLAWLYGAGSALVRRTRMARGGVRGNARVVSVGALEVGGSGKTPLAMLLLEEHLAQGKSCAYASRGYRSRAGRQRTVTVVQGSSPAAAWSRAATRIVSRDHPDLAREVGDEAAVVASRIPGAGLFLSRDKRRAVAAALVSGADVVVVDDAFQTWQLARSVDVVVLNARRPTAGGRLLPAGRLREPPSALARADVIVFNDATDEDEVARARALVARWMRAETPVHGLRRVVRLVEQGGRAGPAPVRALLVSGIACPDAFARSVQTMGIEVVAHEVFRDHHSYTADDARTLAARSRECPGAVMITTEKDWVKLRRFDWGGIDVRIARLDVQWVGVGVTV